uniref:Uncharacterized protein n=1 Tax=Caenorhabditis japonica TaxID=281687 RepID=A0A8R1DQC6_CAEJA
MVAISSSTADSESPNENRESYRLCENTPPFSLSTWEDWKKYLKKATRRITVVQQPLERFARSFRKICVQDQKCYDCKDNVACFMRKLLKDHEKLAEGLEGTVRTFLTDNFSPQTWNCHLHRDLHNVKILKLGGNGPEKLEFARNLNVVLNEQGVPPELQKIVEKEVMKIPLKLSDEEKKIMETVKRDEDLWRLFRYLYEHDFTVFGYKL